MKIKSIKLKDFKRFKDLSVEAIPESAKLVVLVGPNGSGKSSLLEAFNAYAKARSTTLISSVDYLHKRGDGESNISDNEYVFINEGVPELIFHSGVVPGSKNEWKKVFCIRTAHRNDPRFKLNRLDSIEPSINEVRFKTLVENDSAVSLNFRRLASDAMVGAFQTLPGGMNLDEFRDEIIGDIRRVMENLFSHPKLTLNGIGAPLTDGTFRFTKGTSQKFLYENLSGGEKSAFDLILDIIVKRKDFHDSVFCIDEPEAHIHTNLQGPLLEELCNLIPGNAQLWIATHSIGMMRKAFDLWSKDNGKVVFLNFDMDFDKPQILRPAKPNRAFWKSVYDIALDDLSNLVVPEQIVLCEGKPDSPREGFDAKCYNKIFENEMPNTLFISVGGSRDVQKSHLLTLINDIANTKVIRLIDRDNHSEEAIERKKADGVQVLKRRSIESYILDVDVLRILCERKGSPEKADELITAKSNAIQTNPDRKKPPDDLKSAAHAIYVAATRLLQLTQAGNDAEEFMLDTLSPLITPDTEVYQQLKNEIFGAQE